MTEPDNDPRPYRPCVGVMLLNAEGKVFVGNRIDMSGDHWQMPQGGIDEGEDPRGLLNQVDILAWAPPAI